MKRFVCRKLRLLCYLTDRGFVPYGTEPSNKNPDHTVFLFEETPALTAAITQYFAVDCYTAQNRIRKEQNYNEKLHKENI